MPIFELEKDGKVFEVDAPDMQTAASSLGGGGAQQQPNTAIDMLRTVPGALASGVAALAGLPGDLQQLIVGQKTPLGPPRTNEIMDTVSAPFGGVYQPKTTAGEYAQTIGSFAPAALSPGSAAARIARVVVPGATSETAGQLTKDTPYEPYARVGGAILGGAATELGRAAARPLSRVANKGVEAIRGRGFLNPETEAVKRIQEAINREGGTGPITRSLQEWAQTDASNPALIDVSGGNVRRLVRAAAGGSEGNAQNIAQQYLDRIQAGIQDEASRITRGLTPGNTQNADQALETLKANRSAAAKPFYEEAFRANENIGSSQIDEILQTPAGQSALAQARVKMQNARAPMGEAERVQPTISAPSTAGAGSGPKIEKGDTLYTAIRKLGGIRTHDGQGFISREGGEVRHALKDVRTSGLINNQRGMTPDKMREALAQEGWFGRQGGAGADIDEFYQALRQGRDMRHPEMGGGPAAGVSEANARNIGEMRDLADELGVGYRPSWGADEINQAVNNAERSAMRTGGAPAGRTLQTLDYVKRSLDDRIGMAQRAGANDEVRILTGLKNDLLREVEAADVSGKYAQARGAFEKGSVPIEALDHGKTGPVTPSSVYGPGMARFSAPEARGAAQVGYRQGLLDTIERPAAGSTGALNRIASSTQQGENLAATFGQPTAQRYQQSIGNEISRLRNARGISPTTGSQTALRSEEMALVDALPFGQKAGMVARAIDLLKRGLSLTEAEKEAIVRLGTTEADLRRVLQSTPPRTSALAIAQRLLVSAPAAAAGAQ